MKKSNRATLIGSIIYLGIGVLSLVSYLKEAKEEKSKFGSELKKVG